MLLLTNAITVHASATGMQGLFPSDAPSQGRGRVPRRRAFLHEMFEGAGELRSSLQQLDAIVVYARSFPYRNRKVTKAGHLRYHYEAYIQEVALVRMRLLRHLSALDRLYRRDARYPEIKKLIAVFRQSANEAFRDFVNIRDGHIHESRLSDGQLTFLSALEVIIAVDPDRATTASARRTFAQKYRAAKKDKGEFMKAWNKSIRQHLDMYCQLLIPFVTDSDGQLRWPTGAIS